MMTGELEALRAEAQRAALEVEVVAPGHGNVVVGGLRLHYVDWGTAGRPAILLLHGGALSARSFDLVCLALRDAAHCVALDQRGHGDSEWSPSLDYSTHAHVSDIAGFVDAIGWARFTIVGMSLGGLNAIAYTGSYPDRVRALVLVDVGPELRPEGSARRGAFLRGLAAAGGDVRAYAATVHPSDPDRHADRLVRDLRFDVRRGPDGRWLWKHDPRRYLRQHPRDGGNAARAWLWEPVRATRCPVLVVRGGHSTTFTDDDASKLAATYQRGRWVRIDGAGHNVQRDRPAALAREIERFMRDAGQ